MKDFGTRTKLLVTLLTLTTLLGCGGLNAGTPSAQAAPGLVATSALVDFGSVPVGTTAVRTNIIANTSTSSIVVTSAQSGQADFTITGQKLPLTLKPGQHVAIQISYSPSSDGSSQSKAVLSSTMTRFSTTFVMRGTATRSRLSLTPSTFTFGNVPLGKSATQSAQLSNPGRVGVTITAASISGQGFTLTGLSLPLALPAGHSVTVGVTFSPAAGGTASGAISISGTLSSPSGSHPGLFGGQPTPTPVSLHPAFASLSVPVSGTGMAAGQLAISPASLALGSVRIGASQTQSATLINSSSSDVTVRQVTVSGKGFRMSGLTFPLTLAPGQRRSFAVIFTPQAAGAASGSIAVTSDATNPVVSAPVSASATTAPTVGVLSTSDSSLNFGAVKINATGTQSETLTNTGQSPVVISQAQVTGAGFSATGLNLPLTLSPGQNFTFGTAFTPTSGGNFTGSIAVVSDASDSMLTITLAGTASVNGQLAVSPAGLSFGSVTVGQNKSLTGSLTATGSSITVSSASMSTPEFTISGVSFPLTLAPGQSAAFTVIFKPQASGAASANASFASNASNPSAQQSLTGTGAGAPQHSVALNWNPSSSSVAGYNIYRSTTNGGPYAMINSMNSDTSFTDSSVQSGQTYFYVTTAVDGAGKESQNSNQTQAVVPAP